MKYMFLAAAVLGAAHAYMFGRWLLKHDNTAGACMVYVIAAGSIAISVYRLIAP